jgi:hypothetical protein
MTLVAAHKALKGTPGTLVIPRVPIADSDAVADRREIAKSGADG